MATALITGATSGLGAAFAANCARRGNNLVLVARDAARLASASEELRSSFGVTVEVLVADLAKRDELSKVVDRLGDPGRPIDLLVNNAGFGLTRPLLDADLTEAEQALNVMCLAVLALGGAAGRAMRSRGHGRIINVASLSAWISQGHYSAVKAWVKLYSEGLSNELKGSGVVATALCPGWVRTEFHSRAGITTSGIPDWIWVDAERCVAEALADSDVGKVVSVPTKRWKLAVVGLYLAPRPLVRMISRMLTRARN